MKKKSASSPEEPTQPSADESRHVSKSDESGAVSSAKSPATGVASKNAYSPILDAEAETARKILSTQSVNPQETAADIAESKETKGETPVVVRRTAGRRGKTELLEVPAILLEGDDVSEPAAGGPGEKYSVGTAPRLPDLAGNELPDSYGTMKLFLTARDPHWLYAHWDLTLEQQNEFNSESTDGHLILRIFDGKIEGHPISEIHVHPDARHWFAHVERAGNCYAAELGYYSGLGKWMRVAISSCTVTPPDAAAKEDTAEFATIPFEFPFARLVHIIEDAVRDNLPLAQAIEELRRTGHPDLPRLAHSVHSPVTPPVAPRQWSPAQEQALAKVINIDDSRRVWMGSLEITELIRRRLAHEGVAPANNFFVAETAGKPAGSFGMAVSGISEEISSPLGGGPAAEKGKGFWFNINAELVVYGATEPNAKVTLGGHEIKLRSDGSFSFRFALPDGRYDLPAVAVSFDGTDGRAAELRFSRETQYLGDVGATPQDPALKPPTPDNF